MVSIKKKNFLVTLKQKLGVLGQFSKFNYVTVTVTKRNKKSYTSKFSDWEILQILVKQAKYPLLSKNVPYTVLKL